MPFAIQGMGQGPFTLTLSVMYRESTCLFIAKTVAAEAATEVAALPICESRRTAECSVFFESEDNCLVVMWEQTNPKAFTSEEWKW